MKDASETEVVIIGAGPAGLAAAHACLAGGVPFLIIEAGSGADARDLNEPEDVLQGVGGAGLYSDGKLSYYPSAHALWALPSTNILQRAYTWLHTLASDITPDAPPYPAVEFANEWHEQTTAATFTEKKYRSIVLTDQQRDILLRRLLAPIAHRMLLNSRLTKVQRTNTGFELTVKGRPTGAPEKEILARQIVYCGGRFGALDLIALQPRLTTGFVRFEYGIRIEQPARDFFLNRYEAVDTKLTLRSQDRNTEWRTFCECRKGKVVMGRHGKLATYSGIGSSTSPSSNVGFLTRIASQPKFVTLEQEARRLLEGSVPPRQTPLPEFLNKCRSGNVYGQTMDAELAAGIDQLRSQFQLQDATVYSPCVEGTGFYPWTTAHLETSIPGLFVAGDCTGKFRGLLAAFMSGYYAGERASFRQIETQNQIQSGVHIKRSSITSMPMVFTAQSKKYFYCRDVICEYVLSRGAVPINPFRVFDYFLSDRVDREIIRRGNNQLVSSCDEIWVFGPVADGVLFEIVYALNIGKPIRFFTVETRADEIKEITQLNAVVFEPEIHADRTTKESLRESIRLAFERRHALRNDGELPL